jgi:hypothetical protein
MRAARTRSGDTLAMVIVKWGAGIVAVLTAGFVGWTANTVITLLERVDLLEYTMKFRGLWVQ